MIGLILSLLDVQGQKDLISEYDSILSLRQSEQYIEALSLAGKLKLKCIEQGNDSLLARVYVQIGSLLCINHQCWEGKENYFKALKLGLSLGDNIVASNARLGIAASLLEDGKLDSGTYYLKKNIEDAFQVGDSITAAGIYSNLGFVASKQGVFEDAIGHYSNSLEIWKVLNLRERLVQDALNLGRAYFGASEFQMAMSYQKMSLELAENLGQKGAMSRAAYELSKVYYELDNCDSAYLRLIQADSLSVYTNQNYQDKLTELQVMYDTKELELRNEIQLIRIERDAIKILVLIVSLISISLLAFSLWYFQSKKRKAQNKIANQKINDLLQQQEIYSLQGVLAGQEEERQRIATDLHDKLGAILGMVKLHFSAVEERIDILRDDNKKQYDKANELLDQASTEVRNISHNLLSGVLVKFGLVPALHDLKDTVEATGKLKIQLVVGEQMDARLSGERELQVYRIVQELLSNTLKHARATETVIQLHRTNGEITLVVEDNGMGFDIESAKVAGGIGLKNLEARAAKLDAQLHFDSGKGAGTTVTVTIPMEGESS